MLRFPVIRDESKTSPSARASNLPGPRYAAWLIAWRSAGNSGIVQLALPTLAGGRFGSQVEGEEAQQQRSFQITVRRKPEAPVRVHFAFWHGLNLALHGFGYRK
jgi:hypothetical protein